VDKEDAESGATIPRPNVGLDGRWKDEISATTPVKSKDLHATTTLVIEGEHWYAATQQKGGAIQARGKIVSAGKSLTLEGRIVDAS
jgi:hypothetical protein